MDSESGIKIAGRPAPEWWARLVGMIETLESGSRTMAVHLVDGIGIHLRADGWTAQAIVVAQISSRVDHGEMTAQQAAYALDALTDEPE